MLLCTLLILYSCGGGGDDVAPDNKDTPTTWEFENNSYEGGAAVDNISQDEDLGDFGVLVVTTDQDESNGDYSGSALSFTYTVSGPGNYSVVTMSEFTTERLDDPSARVVFVSCTVGSARVDATRYESLSGGVMSVNIDDDNHYRFNAENLMMTKTIESGQGVPNAPDTGILTINNAYGFGF